MNIVPSPPEGQCKVVERLYFPRKGTGVVAGRQNIPFVAMPILWVRHGTCHEAVARLLRRWNKPV